MMSEKDRLLSSEEAPNGSTVIGMGYDSGNGNHVEGQYSDSHAPSAPPLAQGEAWNDAPAPPSDWSLPPPEVKAAALPPVVFDMVKFTPDDAKAAVEQWAKGTWFKQRGYMNDIAVDNFKVFNAYVSTLENFVEYRKLSPAERPYRGGFVDQGIPVGPWEVIQPPPVYFENRHLTMPLPHSERVEHCHHCHGRGQEQCHSCHGSGHSTCSHCSGRGQVERTEWRQDHNGHRHAHHHHDRCIRCAGSGHSQCFSMTSCVALLPSFSTSCQENFAHHVPCCHGRGMVTCHHCDGTGRLIIYTKLKIEWRNITAQTVVKDVFDPALTQVLPDSKLARGDGPVLLAEQAFMLQPAYGDTGRINPAVNDAIDRLLRDANQPAPRAQHQQRLIVRGLPVYELAYHGSDHKVNRLWVFGTDRKVHAPEYPLSVPRVLALTGIIALFVLALVGLLVFFLYLQPNHIV